MRAVRSEDLQRFAAAVFAAHGASAADARAVAESLVKASLLGHDSHGLLRIKRYVDSIVAKKLNPAAQPRVASQRGATAVIDGGHGFGHVSAMFGVKTALELAAAQGVGAVALSNTNHIGRLADYAEAISATGYIALIFTSGAGPGGSVAPYGGRERVFGTNPIAWGLPVTPPRPPLVADFSTSAVPEGKLNMAQSRGEPAPAGALLDKEGRPTNNPADFYAGGALLPFGGPKGSSLMLFVEVLACILAGSVPSSSPEYRTGNPTMMLAIKVDAFVPWAEYLRHTEALLLRIENSHPAEGFDRVLLPNALEIETGQRRRREGIPIPDSLWTELAGLAKETGTPLPQS